MFFLILFFCLFHECLAQEFAFLVPSPFSNPSLCNRPNVNSSSICDIHNLLHPTKRDEIEGYMNLIDSADGAVCIIDSLDPTWYITNNEPLEAATERIARRIHDDWQLGKDSEKGFLIFVSVKNRQTFISIGRGLAKILTNDVLDSVISNMKPHFRKANYAEGIISGLLEIKIILSKSDSANSGSTSTGLSLQENIEAAFLSDSSDGGAGGAAGGKLRRVFGPPTTNLIAIGIAFLSYAIGAVVAGT